MQARSLNTRKFHCGYELVKTPLCIVGDSDLAGIYVDLTPTVKNKPCINESVVIVFSGNWAEY